MNKEIKAKWLKALRSGEYKQGKERLYHAGRHCCLGVLADIQGEPIRSRKWCKDQREEYYLTGTGLRKTASRKLATMNDDGDSFANIANYIEQNL